MNTDRENTVKENAIASEWLRPWQANGGSPCSAILISFGFSLSVFIRVHPWFQRIYPTDAS
jgi:hypothetical protein